jgi:tight adherence protein C
MAALYGLLGGLTMAAGVLAVAALRRNPLEEVAAADLVIITERGRRGLAGPRLRQRIGAPIGRLIQASTGAWSDRLLNDLIARSGRSAVMTVTDFYTQQGFYLAVLWAFGALAFVRGLPGLVCVFVLVLPVAAPWYHLWATARERQDKIDQDLPDFLDVLAVVVSAGLNFQQALDRVSRRYGGPLADEMQVALRQITVGESLRAALQSLQRRSNSDSIDQFVTALLQAEELGAPLTHTLNQIAQDVRREAAQQARRRAAAAAPKATIVTILLLLPPTMAVLVYGVITAVRAG